MPFGSVADATLAFHTFKCQMVLSAPLVLKISRILRSLWDVLILPPLHSLVFLILLLQIISSYISRGFDVNVYLSFAFLSLTLLQFQRPSTLLCLRLSTFSCLRLLVLSAFACVCLRLVVCVCLCCLRLSAFSCLRLLVLSAFACVCLRLSAFVSILIFSFRGSLS